MKRLAEAVIIILAISATIGTLYTLFIHLKTPKTKLSVVQTAEKHPEFKNVRVEVLNASGIPDLARKVTIFLRDLGFDVVYYGNYRGKPVERSVIVDRVSRDMKNATLIQRVTNIPITDYEKDPDKLLEVSLVLGKDAPQYFGKLINKPILY